MIHENGTMDVRVDGKIERRRYSIDREAPFTNRYIERVQTKYKPELREGEEAFFSLGDDIPTIVLTQQIPYRSEEGAEWDAEFGSFRR